MSQNQDNKEMNLNENANLDSNENSGSHHHHHHHHHHSSRRRSRHKEFKPKNRKASIILAYNIVLIILSVIVFTLFLCYGIFKGPAGERGPQGEKGETGKQGIQGDAGLDGQTPVKGEDYFTEKDIEEIIEQLKQQTDDLPKYWLNHLETQADVICEKMELAGNNKSSFLWYNDAHWSNNAKRSPALLKWLSQNTPITKTNFGGDVVNDEPTLETLNDREIMQYVWEWRAAVSQIPNHHSVVGNHDDGNATNFLFDENRVYAYLFAAEESNAIVRGDTCYYYIDDYSESTRYLYLDTAYKGLDIKQLNFITEALKSTPKAWHVVAISHIWHDMNYDILQVGNFSNDGRKLLALFDRYNARQGEFSTLTSDKGGRVEFCIGGHTHIDHVSTSDGGIPVILTETDSGNVRSGLERSLGTITESSVNAIIANYNTNKISIIRIGRGTSREIPMSSRPAEYNNKLSTALDRNNQTNVLTNGTTVGYLDNRFYGASNTYVETEGWDTSGLIAVNVGDIVRLKNIVFYPYTATDPYAAYANVGCISLYDQDGNYLSGISLLANDVSTWGRDYRPKFDENGNLIEFLIPAWGKIGYFSISAQDINENSIITVNQTIVGKV